MTHGPGPRAARNPTPIALATVGARPLAAPVASAALRVEDLREIGA